ncbi:hypothetical protein [Pseudanabaena sp. BC1403]|uniref:hypothetical protein n=1 Tax=Pseudanabaena sp. BC1403 TaxID=2043171 RepID=UPI0011AED1E7|nr:hypothetical protein [Pseudanabaena sp. BC1403]
MFSSIKIRENLAAQSLLNVFIIFNISSQNVRGYSEIHTPLLGYYTNSRKCYYTVENWCNNLDAKIHTLFVCLSKDDDRYKSQDYID